MTISTLLNSSTGIAYMFPGGVPNKDEIFAGNPDTRSRKFSYKGYIGTDSLYTAYDLLRTHIGPSHNSEFCQARNIEVITEKFFMDDVKNNEMHAVVSTVSRAFIHVFKKMHTVVSTTNRAFIHITKKMIKPQSSSNTAGYSYQNNLSHLSLKELFIRAERDLGGSGQAIAELIDSYYKDESSLNFVSFVNKVIPKIIADTQKNTDILNSQTLESYGAVVAKNADPQIIESLLNHVMARRLQLTPSTWRPEQLFDNLIAVLKAKGPMVIAANLGKFHYENEAIESKRTLNGYPIWYFPKGSEYKFKGAGSTLVIVGAERVDTQELIYAIDERERTDPTQPIPFKLYTYSYKRLREAMTNIEPIGVKMLDGKEDIPETYGFHAHEFDKRKA